MLFERHHEVSSIVTDGFGIWISQKCSYQFGYKTTRVRQPRSLTKQNLLTQLGSFSITFRETYCLAICGEDSVVFLLEKRQHHRFKSKAFGQCRSARCNNKNLLLSQVESNISTKFKFVVGGRLSGNDGAHYVQGLVQPCIDFIEPFIPPWTES